MLEDGNKAPKIDLLDDDGSKIEIANSSGRMTVLYFYPKDDTSGCTAQAKDFTCMADQFEGAGAHIVGVSPDDAVSHKKFRKKYDLNVTLACDTERRAATAFGVWVEKSMYGKKYMGVERSTFLIDASGRIVKSWRKVKVPGHAAEVLEAVRQTAQKSG